MPTRWTRRCAQDACTAATAILLVAAWVSSIPLGHAQSQACTPQVARVVSLQGSVELRSAVTGQWERVKRLDTPLCLGDRLRTGPNSRAALFIPSENLLRVDQNTTVSVHVDQDETIVEFFIDKASRGNACGAGYAISRLPRKFKIYTPFSYASVEGTEFLVSLACTQATVSVFEGKVSVEQRVEQASKVVLGPGQTTSVGPDQPPAVRVLVKPVDAVQWALYYPPLADPQFGTDPLHAPCDSLTEAERPACLLERAEALLRAGQVDQAQADIRDLLMLQPKNGDAFALRAVIGVVKNETADGLRFAHEATTLTPNAYRPWLALSYAQQAAFKLEEALTSARKAAALAPRSGLVQARVAELLTSLGRIREAERAARHAVAVDPNQSRAHVILGFVHLAEVDTKSARQDFARALELDSTDPLSRLGMGIAIIRDGNIKAGREQIEIAVALDPTNSMLRSYVGKAYYEENTPARDRLAASQFSLAKELDPNDPTPWFYDAILKQTQNRPVEALEELQKSIELNNNRAIYRSKLLLDQDQGSRGASLAQIYQDVRFQQLALFEAYRSIGVDPGNPAAHRFLSDAFSLLPRHELAQTSELLQSELRQPLTLDPLPPQRTAADLSIPRGSGPAALNLYELNPLFVSQGLSASVDALVGEMDTSAGQATLAMLGDRASARGGVFHFTSNGFRNNNDLDRTIGDAFFQVAPTPEVGLQMELRHSDFESGDLPLRFDPALVFPTRHTETQDSARLGARYVFSPAADLVFSGIYETGTLGGTVGPLSVTDEISSTQLEVQSLMHIGRTDLTVGLGHLAGTLVETFGGFTNPEQEREQGNQYVYASIRGGSFLQSIQLGLSADQFDEAAISRSEVNPKIGLVLTPTRTTTVRAAYIQSLRRILPTGQTIEPTQVAGFNQLFNDPEGTIIKLLGIGVDQQFGTRTFAGLELTQRDLTVPVIDFSTGKSLDIDWTEQTGRAYFYWAPHARVALTAEAFYEQYERSAAFLGEEQILDLKSWRVPIGGTVFLGSSWAARAAWTFWHQEGTFLTPAGDTFPGQEDFSVVDVQLAYRLPFRKGFIVIGANNLLDTKSNYQETDLASPRYIPQRFAYVRVSLAF